MRGYFCFGCGLDRGQAGLEAGVVDVDEDGLLDGHAGEAEVSDGARHADLPRQAHARRHLARAEGYLGVRDVLLDHRGQIARAGGRAAHVVDRVRRGIGFDEDLGELAQVIGGDQRRLIGAVHLHGERLADGGEGRHVRPVLRRRAAAVPVADAGTHAGELHSVLRRILVGEDLGVALADGVRVAGIELVVLDDVPVAVHVLRAIDRLRAGVDDAVGAHQAGRLEGVAHAEGVDLGGQAGVGVDVGAHDEGPVDDAVDLVDLHRVEDVLKLGDLAADEMEAVFVFLDRLQEPVERRGDVHRGHAVDGPVVEQMEHRLASEEAAASDNQYVHLLLLRWLRSISKRGCVERGRKARALSRNEEGKSIGVGDGRALYQMSF